MTDTATIDAPAKPRISERAAALVKPPKEKRARAIVCPCCEFKFELDSEPPRSLPQHRRFFLMVSAAYFHWPETHETQFLDREDLRAWLIMKAGYRETVLDMKMGGTQALMAAKIAGAVLTSVGSRARVIPWKGRLIVMRPKSIAWAALGHGSFCKLNDAVSDVIEAELGMTGDAAIKSYIEQR